MKQLPTKQPIAQLLPRRRKAEDAIDASMELPGAHVDDNFLRPLRIGLIVLILGFGGFLAWAALAPLGAGEPAQGTVVVIGNRKVVQHLSGGTVDAILVQDGDHVHAGQVVIRLDPTEALAQQRSVISQYIITKITEARLLAERDDTETMAIDPALRQRFHDNPQYQQVLASQKRLLDTRQQAFANKVAILNENIDGAQEQLKGLRQVKASRQGQIDNINKQLKGIRELAEQGYVPRNQMLKLERDAGQLQASLSDNVVRIGQVRNQVAELKLRILQHRRDYQKKVQSQLSDVRKQANTLRQQLTSLDYRVTQTRIRAPIDGTVQDLQVHTIGGVIRPGTTLLEVIPDDADYIVRAKLPTDAVDRVHPGLPVDIRFPALNRNEVPTVPGRLLTISADSIIDERTGIPYYEMRVKVTEKGRQVLRNQKIRPGMPASVMVQLGERTMLDYLFRPFLERLHTALTEKE